MVFVSLNRATLHELERDAQDKFRARVLDSAAHNTKTTSRGINFYEGIENIDTTYVNSKHRSDMNHRNHAIYF